MISALERPAKPPSKLGSPLAHLLTEDSWTCNHVSVSVSMRSRPNMESVLFSTRNIMFASSGALLPQGRMGTPIWCPNAEPKFVRPPWLCAWPKSEERSDRLIFRPQAIGRRGVDDGSDRVGGHRYKVTRASLRT